MLERYLAKANKRRSIHWIVNFAIKLIKFGRILHQYVIIKDSACHGVPDLPCLKPCGA